MNHLILKQLNDADQSLRENLHRHDLDPTARAHMERALNHVREARIATSDAGKARSVQRLVGDLEKVDHLLRKVRRQSQPGTTIKPIRI